jgi:hypothetical protein
MDWRQRIGELILVKQNLYEVDAKRLWEYKLPRVAATEEQLTACEACLGERLSDDYRAFLRHAAGWPAFLQTIDLFGPEELCGGPIAAHAQTMLGYVEETVLVNAGFSRKDLMPIAVSTEEMDLFVMTRQTTQSPGLVLWLAGGEIDRFSSFEHVFAAVIEYTRNEIVRLQGN